MFVQPSGTSDGSYFDVLMRWDIIVQLGWMYSLSFAMAAGLPSNSIWWGRLIEEWCDVCGATASCLSTCGGSSVVHCGGQLADWSHWCGLPNCGSLLDQLLYRWFAVWCIDFGLCVVHPDFLVRPVILWILSSSWMLCSRGSSWFLCICGLMSVIETGEFLHWVHLSNQAKQCSLYNNKILDGTLVSQRCWCFGNLLYYYSTYQFYPTFWRLLWAI